MDDSHYRQILSIATRHSAGKYTEDELSKIRNIVQRVCRPRPYSALFDAYLFGTEVAREQMAEAHSPRCLQFLKDSYYICSCTNRVIFICDTCNQWMTQHGHNSHIRVSGQINIMCQCSSHDEQPISVSTSLIASVTTSTKGLQGSKMLPSRSKLSTKISHREEEAIREFLYINNINIDDKPSNSTDLSQSITLSQSDVSMNFHNRLKVIKGVLKKEQSLGDVRKEFQKLRPIKLINECLHIDEFCERHSGPLLESQKLPLECTIAIKEFILMICERFYVGDLTEALRMVEYATDICRYPAVNTECLLFLSSHIERKQTIPNVTKFFTVNSSGITLLSYLCDQFCKVARVHDEIAQQLFILFSQLGVSAFTAFNNAVVVSSMPNEEKTRTLEAFWRSIFGIGVQITNVQKNAIVVQAVLDVFSIRRQQIKNLSATPEVIPKCFTEEVIALEHLQTVLAEFFAGGNMYYLCQVLLTEHSIFHTFLDHLFYLSALLHFDPLKPFSYIETLHLKLYSILGVFVDSLCRYLNMFVVTIKHFTTLKEYLNLCIQKLERMDKYTQYDVLLYRMFALFVRKMLLQKSSKSLTYKIVSGYIKLKEHTIIGLMKSTPEGKKGKEKVHIEVPYIFSDHIDMKKLCEDKEEKQQWVTQSEEVGVTLRQQYVVLFSRLREYDHLVEVNCTQYGEGLSPSKTLNIPKQYMMLYSFDPLLGLSLDQFLLQLIICNTPLSMPEHLVLSPRESFLTKELEFYSFLLNDNNYDSINQPKLKYYTMLLMLFVDFNFVKCNITTKEDVISIQHLCPDVANYITYDNGVVSFSFEPPQDMFTINLRVMNRIPYSNPHVPLMYVEKYKKTWIRMFNESAKYVRTPFKMFSATLLKFPYFDSMIENIITFTCESMQTAYFHKEDVDEVFFLLRICWIIVSFTINKDTFPKAWVSLGCPLILNSHVDYIPTLIRYLTTTKEYYCTSIQNLWAQMTPRPLNIILATPDSSTRLISQLRERFEGTSHLIDVYTLESILSLISHLTEFYANFRK